MAVEDALKHADGHQHASTSCASRTRSGPYEAPGHPAPPIQEASVAVYPGRQNYSPRPRATQYFKITSPEEKMNCHVATFSFQLQTSLAVPIPPVSQGYSSQN
ncbi:hypothetical protein BaRGS_00016598 [Batillaria attramentaria]|uniref:Uncharacterized protein n=1 Tax=Batillaria attramentaria TaxID=370345 RepID=A0ABD0KY74_9CAEN